MASHPEGAGSAALPMTWQHRFMYLQVVVCGAVVMLVEILGTRIIGPVFGVGLFVWSALLSVRLLALAVGYFAGGVWPTKRRRAAGFPKSCSQPVCFSRHPFFFAFPRFRLPMASGFVRGLSSLLLFSSFPPSPAYAWWRHLR